jgi:tRNA A-37 threonylcarbamoyl transferase component Bud32/TolA-binding protein
LLAPRVDPKYEIVRKLREGGMGAIYLVRHRLLDELRVIKVLRSHLDLDEDLRQRFLREAKTAIQLRHPNIAQLYDFSVDEEGNASIVLEYIDGVTLEEFGRRPEARNVALDLAIAQQALRAIGFLHRKGFVHRDIAPDNLMLTSDVDGEPLVKLIDLGIVKILKSEGKGTATSLYLGKPRYSSPEQLSSPDIDARADLYSFGVMLYELVTGCYPIRGHDLPSLIAAHLHGEPVPFDVSDPENRVPPPLRELLLAAMARDPAARPGSAEEFAARLAAIQRDFPPPPASEAARLLQAAREGAKSEREQELARAGSEALSLLGRGEFGGARARVAAAVARLGNEPELLDLSRRIDEREREKKVAEAEAERFEQLLAEAERAFADGDVPGALSKITEVLARRPNDARARTLAARIDERRRADEERAAREAEAEAVPATLRVERGAGLHDAPTSELRTLDAAEASAWATAAAPAPSPRPAPPAAAAPAAGGRGLRVAALAGLAVAVATGGWLLWRGMTGGGAAGTDDPYRTALAALAGGDAAGAARQLREVLLADPKERSGYLPHFYYGQALATLGDCEAALAALAESEGQGVLASSPEAAMVAAVRARCAALPALDSQLAPVEEALLLLDRQIAEIEGSKTSSEVAELWRSRADLSADYDRARELTSEARQLARQARESGDLDLAFQAADRAADARDRLAGVLRAIDTALGRALAE